MDISRENKIERKRRESLKKRSGRGGGPLKKIKT
jgi:hypothetical protein